MDAIFWVIGDTYSVSSSSDAWCANNKIIPVSMYYLTKHPGLKCDVESFLYYKNSGLYSVSNVGVLPFYNSSRPPFSLISDGSDLRAFACSEA
jgi:hypothetical protein